MSKKRIVILSLVIILSAGYLYGSATYKYLVPRGLSIGDILYSNVPGQMTNLNSGALGTVLQSAGLLTAPAYVAKNTFREATIHNFATAAASWALSADEQLCFLLVGTNANAANTIAAPATAGKVFFLRNGTGQNMTIHYSNGTGVTVATGYGQLVMYSSNIGDYIKIGTAATAP